MGGGFQKSVQMENADQRNARSIVTVEVGVMPGLTGEDS
jgi:hypothetical protein